MKFHYRAVTELTLGVVQHLERGNLNRRAICQMNTPFKNSFPFSQKCNLWSLSRRKQDGKIKPPVLSSDLQLNPLRLKSIKNWRAWNLLSQEDGLWNLTLLHTVWKISFPLSFILFIITLVGKRCKKKSHRCMQWNEQGIQFLQAETFLESRAACILRLVSPLVHTWLFWAPNNMLQYQC